MGRAQDSTGIAQALCGAVDGTYHKQVVNPPISGRLFAKSKQVVLADVVDALDVELPFLLGTVEKGPRAAVGSLVVMTRLPRPVPNLVLFSASNSSVLRRSGIALDESQAMRLEGTFNETFRLYAPATYKTAALYVFAPDLMGRLIDTVGGCDVEFVDNRALFYISKGKLKTVEDIQTFLEALKLLNSKIQRQTRFYKDETAQKVLIADPFKREQVLAVGGSDTGHRVASSGDRIRTRLTLWQKIGCGIALCVAVAAGIYWVTSIVRAFSV